MIASCAERTSLISFRGTFFGRAEARAYWRSYFGFAACTLALCAVAWLAVWAIPVDGMPGLVLKGAVAFAVVSALLLALFRHDISALLRSREGAFTGEVRRS